MQNFLMRTLLMIASMIVSGFMVTILWGWFIAPVFNVIVINIPQAIGLLLILNILKMKSKDLDRPEKEIEVLVDDFLNILILCIVSLLSGWIVQLFL